MSDITKCAGYDCPLRDGCYRYRASEGFRQSWFCEDPRKPDGSCDEFWPDRSSSPSSAAPVADT